jgi:hypothetical protein
MATFEQLQIRQIFEAETEKETGQLCISLSSLPS